MTLRLKPKQACPIAEALLDKRAKSRIEKLDPECNRSKVLHVIELRQSPKRDMALADRKTWRREMPDPKEAKAMTLHSLPQTAFP
jgi:hypothetical protein